MKSQEPPTSPREHFSIPELAEMTGESKAVWRKRILHRQIPFYKLGRNVRVSKQDYDGFLAARRRQAQ